MGRQCALLGLAAISVLVCAHTAARDSVCSLQDSFDDEELSTIWSSYADPELAVELSDGQLRIYGTAHIHRYSYAGVSMVNPFEVQSFESSIDLLAVTGTYGGAEHLGRHYSFRANGGNGHYVELTYWADEYRISWDNGQGWQRIYAPSNGDEKTTWYRWEIIYDADTQEANVYVDERQIGGTAVVDLGGWIQIEVEHQVGHNADQEGLWDNFCLRNSQFAFSEIDPTLMALRFDGENAYSDRYELAGRLVIAEESDGFDLLNEDVSIQVGTSVITIPAGSFSVYGSIYWLNESTEGVSIQAYFFDHGDGQLSFLFGVANVDLSGTPNPVNCKIWIGNDSGNVVEKLDGQLRNSRPAIVPR